ncbi:MAG: hypothetical protein R3B47_01120 [Bacteroidia bacterium]
MPRLIPVLFLIFLFACNNSSEESCAAPAETAVTSTNPNGDSELALLMRDMFKDSWKARQAVLKGENPGLDVETLERIHSAQATEPEKAASPAFAAMSDTYLAAVKALNAASDSAGLSKNYSLMIKQCEVCHQQFCPGPLVKIQKLRLN